MNKLISLIGSDRGSARSKRVSGSGVVTQSSGDKVYLDPKGDIVALINALNAAQRVS
jgi:hypothetical protein